MDNNRLNQRGSVMVLVAILLAGFMGFAALAIDIGHVMVVQNELQNAADSAAITGAYSLSSSPTSSSTVTAVQTAVTSAVGLNKSDGVALTGATVSTGWWNLASPSPQTLASTQASSSYCPAVQVTVSRSTGNNGGPVQNWFGPVIGIKTSNVSATATAVITSPVIAPAGTVLPVAISSKSWYFQNWQNYCGSRNQIQLGPGGNNFWDYAGQCTSFLTDSSSINTFCGLCQTLNPSQLSVGGNNIWIEQINSWTWDQCQEFCNNNYQQNSTVLVPVVGDCSQHESQAIKGFMAFYVTGYGCNWNWDNCSPYVNGYFQTNYYASPTSGKGSGSGYANLGVASPPFLVQ